MFGLDDCMDQSQLKTPPCSLIDTSNAAAEWEQLTEAQIEVGLNSNYLSFSFFQDKWWYDSEHANDAYN